MLPVTDPAAYVLIHVWQSQRLHRIMSRCLEMSDAQVSFALVVRQNSYNSWDQHKFKVSSTMHAH
jgi:hypothetical protein